MEVSQVKSRIIIGNSHILKPSYHMNYGKIRIEKAIYNEFPFDSLGNVSASVFTGGIFKRMFVDDTKYGYPYISAQHMMNTNPLDVAKIISKKYTPRQEEMSLKEGQILVSCAGTVGNVRLITKDLEGVIGSQDIIRVNPDDTKLPYGYLYAYLASKTAYNYMQSYIYGSVVPRIEPNTLSRLPIPILSEEKQQQIHHLIVEASELRVEANRLLNEAIITIEKKCPIINNEKIYSIKIRERFFHSKRLEATYNSKSIDKFYSELSKNEIELKSIAELSQSVFTPNIFKRIRTENPETGIPFLSGSELLQQYPRFQNYLSKGMKNIENYILKDGWLAIQDAGTIGYLSYIHKYLDGVTATNNLIRIIPSEDNYNYYIYAFLKSNIGQKLLKFLEFGSVQKHIDNHQISNFKIPIFKDIFEDISRNVENAMNYFSDSCFKENQAIALIEKEIDLWQVS